MPLKLTPVVKGGGPSILLQRPILLVGRHPECDWRLDLPKISRRHCCFALAYDRVLIRDLGSRNGVRVNGRDVDETQLFQGDEVAIGPLIFRVEQEPEAAPRTPRAAPASPATSENAPGSRNPADDGPEIELISLDDI